MRRLTGFCTASQSAAHHFEPRRFAAYHLHYDTMLLILHFAMIGAWSGDDTKCNDERDEVSFETAFWVTL